MRERHPDVPLGDIPASDMRAHLHRIADWIADYRENIAARAISPTVEPGDIAERMQTHAPTSAEPLTQIIDDLDSVVMPGIVHWGHPAFLGYFGSTSNEPALLGEMVAAALNVSAMTWKTSPSATEMETVVLRWIRDMMGLSKEWFGVVYDTASIGLVHALAAAREAAGDGIRERGLAGRSDVGVMRIYASTQAHSSIEKAAILLGIGEQNVVRVEADASQRLDPAALRRAMEAGREEGSVPLAVIATVGTTSTASVDPLEAIADVCAEHGAWLHVDAAYGGALAVVPEHRDVLQGAERADSIIVNPHKWLFVPLDFSTLYIRRPDLLRAVFSLVPEYLSGDAASNMDATPDDKSAKTIDYMDYGVQLGRRFRALKAWFVIRSFGSDGIAARIREHCRLARLLASWIEAHPHFDLAAPQSMAVVCFYYTPNDVRSADTDDAAREIVRKVNAEGLAYITHTVVNGRVALRMGIGNIATTEQHVQIAWDAVLRAAAQSA